MSGIDETFEALCKKSEKALVVFVTGGDPPIEHLPAILQTLEAAGADIIEVGLPFSDPIADGPTIQSSSQRALDRGVRTQDIFDAVKAADISVPIVYMGYTNTAMRHGFRDFAQRAAASGATGALLSDLTPDEATEWRSAAKLANLDTVFLVAPTSTDKRIKLACDSASGFVYCVSRTGVTGAASVVPQDVSRTINRVKSFTALPVCVGFGISIPEQVRMVCSVADGAVVGSHIVALLNKCWNDGSGSKVLHEEVAALKAATRI